MVGLALSAVLIAVLFAAGLQIRLGRTVELPNRIGIGLFFAGALIAAPSLLLESYVLDILGISLRVIPPAQSGSLTAAFLVVSPLEHLALAIVVWPLYRARRFLSTGTSVTAAALAALGFGALAGGYAVVNAPGAWTLVRACIDLWVRAFSAGLWGTMLGSARPLRNRWFPAVWLLAVLVTGLSFHIVDGRGTGWSIGALPLLLVMGAMSVWLLRQIEGPRKSLIVPRPIGLILPEAVSIDGVRAVFQHRHRPALLHWIVGGALVTFGGVLATFALSIVVAHWVGVDLSRADESGVGAMVPITLMGTFVLAAFPLSGYLVARASAADSIFEPAMGAALAIAFITLLLWMTAPVAIVLIFALAPLAFGLTCFGAWLGLARPR